MEILTDSGAVFINEEFKKFVDSWDMHLQFRCVYLQSGNGIIEGNHRTVQTITVKKDCTVFELVYNVTPKDDISVTATDTLHKYHVRVKGIEAKLEVTREKFKKGDVVWDKNLRDRCTRYGIKRVDHVPCHIKDLWPATQLQPPLNDKSESD